MTTESKKPKPYDRSALFKLAWEYARYTSTLVEIPAHKLIGSAIWTVWRLEKSKREVDELDSLTQEFADKIVAIARPLLDIELARLKL